MLRPYLDRRHFDRTPEPQGGTGEGAGPAFVVQKHAARRLHYDVRLEVDGVMPSWAVPKGPSYDPKVKRLAMHVEDHPLDYRQFEGTIPGGEYGAGAVIVWDRGTYRNITEHTGRSVWLEGTKLCGGWSLTRTAPAGSAKDSWIMVKRRDDHVDPSLDITASAPASVCSGRSIEEVADDACSRQWTRGVATWRPPMLAELVEAAPAGDGWSFERKLDGLRCVAVRNGDEVELWSRNHLSFTARFPDIVTALRDLDVDNLALDGEIVAMDGERSSFSLLQGGSARAEPAFHVFDVVHLLGSDTSSLPLRQRRALLAQAVSEGPHLRVVRELEGEPTALWGQACAEGWEGIIAKLAEGTYVSGRSSEWRKLKCSASQELVVGGWTDPRGARTGFGALLVGYYDGADLRYAGKVGTGFGAATLATLHRQMSAYERSGSPFADRVSGRGLHWTEPRLRPDKDPRSVTREQGAAGADRQAELGGQGLSGVHGPGLSGMGERGPLGAQAAPPRTRRASSAGVASHRRTRPHGQSSDEGGPNPPYRQETP